MGVRAVEGDCSFTAGNAFEVTVFSGGRIGLYPIVFLGNFGAILGRVRELAGPLYGL